MTLLAHFAAAHLSNYLTSEARPPESQFSAASTGQECRHRTTVQPHHGGRKNTALLHGPTLAFISQTLDRLY